MSEPIVINSSSSKKKSKLEPQDLEFLHLTGRNAYYHQGYCGQGINVAVIDTGINANHPEFKGRIIGEKSFIYYGNKNKAVDDNGHGSHVSSSIVGKTVGVAPQAKILAIKTCNAQGGGRVSDTIDALNYIASRDDIDIVSMSLSWAKSHIKDYEIKQMEEAIDNCIDKNIIVICAAGNSGTENTLRYPSGLPNPVTVGAINQDESVAYFTTETDEVDVCQVGVDVWGADFESEGYKLSSGTSMATPITAGIATLIACKYKALFGKRIKEEVLYEMLKMNTVDMYIDGVDSRTGAGLCTLKPTHRTLEMWIGLDSYKVDGVTKKMDTKPFIDTENNRVQAPVRFVAEPFGILTKWDGFANQITFIE